MKSVARRNSLPTTRPGGPSPYEAALSPARSRRSSAIKKLLRNRDHVPAVLRVALEESMSPLLGEFIKDPATTYTKLSRELRGSAQNVKIDDVLYALYRNGRTNIHFSAMTHDRAPVTQTLLYEFGLPFRTQILKHYGIQDPIGLVLVDILVSRLIDYWSWSHYSLGAGHSKDGLNLKVSLYARKTLDRILGQVTHSIQTLNDLYRPQMALKVKRKARYPGEPEPEIHIF